MDGVQTVFEGYTDTIYYWQNSMDVPQLAYTLGTPIPTAVPAGGLAPSWDITSWGNWTVATPGTGSILLKQGTVGAFTPITGTRSPLNAKILVRRSPYLMAGNTSLGPTTIMWCDVDDIQTWNPLPSNEAGSYPIRDMASELTCGLEFLGDSVWFGRNSVHAGLWVGSPNIFIFKKMLDDIGAVGPKAAVSVGTKLYGVGERGIWESDLYTYNYDDTPIIRTFLRERLNVPQRSQICVSFDAANKLVVFSFPEVGQDMPSAALVWDLDGKQWGRLTYGWSAFDSGDVFDYAITADSKGGVWGQTQESEAISGLSTGTFNLVEQAYLSAGYGESGYGVLAYGGYYPIGNGNPVL
jgi:hypothetical protein